MRGMIHPAELWNCHSGFSQGLTGPGFRSHAGIYFTRVLSKTRTTTAMATPLTDHPEHDQNTTDAAMRRRISALQEEVVNLRHPPKQAP